MTVGKRDEDGNVAAGDTTLVNTKSSLIVTHGVHLAVQGLEDVAVIASEDAVYVGHLEEAEDIGKLVRSLVKSTETSSLTEIHRTSYYQCGGYISLLNGDRFQVKRCLLYRARSCRYRSNSTAWSTGAMSRARLK